ncbi:MAG: NAD-dependent epimerase/dehydratase family protein [Candidatus Dormibacteraceae bacterium]
MRMLVTGASGFVGSHVVRALVAEGHEVTALVREDSSLWRLEELEGSFKVARLPNSASGALLDPLGAWQPEVCVHLAWYAVPGEYLRSPENIPSLMLTLRLLEELAAAGCKHVVMTGTCFEYDTDLGYLREDGPMRPATIYAAAKLAASLLGQHRAAQLGIGFAWARLFYIYGPFEDERRLVPSLVRALLEGREFPASSGSQVRDYLHVEDLSAALSALAVGQVGGTYNVCSGDPITIAGLMAEVERIAGRPGLIRLGALPMRPGEPKFICGDNSRLRAATGWKPRHSLPEGLADTVAWWKRFSLSRPVT